MALAEFTQPIYQAVVATLALENMRKEESEKHDEQLLTRVCECLTSSKHVVRILTEADFSKAQWDGIPPVHVAMCILVNVTRTAINNTRENLPNVCEKYRDVTAAVLDDMDVVVDRLEEIAEGWCMAVDEAVTAEVKDAISASTARNNAEITDWRIALAGISD